MTTGSPVGGTGHRTPGDAGLSGVRERLIEAMAEASYKSDIDDYRTACEGRAWRLLTPRDRATYLLLAGPLLAAVLPLIADEIEALHITAAAAYGAGWNSAVGGTAALVRSWAADGAR